MTEPLLNTDKPFYRSGLSPGTTILIALAPIYVLMILVNLFAFNTTSDVFVNRLFFVFMPLEIIYALIVCIFRVRRFKLYDDRIEITYPLRFKPFFSTNKKVFMNTSVEKVSIIGGMGGKYSATSIRFNLKENEKSKIYRFDIMWVKDMKSIYSKYKESEMEIEVKNDKLRKVMKVD